MTDITDKNSGNDKNGKSNEGGKSGKLQPKLRFKGFTDAWEQRALGDILVIHSSKDYIKDPDRVGEYEVIQQGNNPVAGYANGEQFKRYTEVILFGDHTVSLYRPQGPFFIATDGMKIIGAKANFRSTYLYFVLERYKPQSEGYKRHLGILKKTNVSISLGSREQECIGSLFRCFDSLIAAAERKVLLLKKKKHAYLNHIFTQHLRFTGHTTPWQTKKLGELFMLKTGGGTPRTTKGEYWGGDIPWIQSSDLESGKLFSFTINKCITNEGLNNSAAKLVPSNSIAIVTRVGVGKLALIKFPFTTSQDFLSLTGTNQHLIYLSYSISVTLNKLTLQTQGTSIKGISKAELLNAKISFPFISEQAKIGNFFQTLDSLIAAAERKVSLLKKKKQAYLQKMFI